MTTQFNDDGLLGTFAVISPERWEDERARLRELDIGSVWLAYEHLQDDIRMDEWHLSDPDSFMEPEEIPQRIIEWDEDRQFLFLYEEVLREKGWDGEGPPEGVPHCRVCGYRMGHWDREEHVCGECRADINRDIYDEWRREDRYR